MAKHKVLSSKAKASSRKFSTEILARYKAKIHVPFLLLRILSLNINILTYINFSDIQNCSQYGRIIVKSTYVQIFFFHT